MQSVILTSFHANPMKPHADPANSYNGRVKGGASGVVSGTSVYAGIPGDDTRGGFSPESFDRVSHPGHARLEVVRRVGRNGARTADV